MDNFYIYKYVDNKNNIIYIGKTNNIERRIKEHKKDKLKNFNGDIYYFTCSSKILTISSAWELVTYNT